MIRSRVTIHAGADRRRAVSELLFGEEFAVLDVADGVAWGRSIRDDYVGYVSADSLRPSAAMSPPTHRLAADALVYAEPDMKSRVTDALPLNAVVHATRVDPAWHRVGRGLIHDRALARLDRVGGDLLAVAMRFLGSPYRWGGRTRAGVDCSGLVQAAAYAVGLSCARDTDQQRETTGDAVDPDAARRTGDIVYFPGHVGIMADGDRLLHATAFWMTTLIEPLADVVARARASNPRPILAVRRLNACLQPSGDL